MKFYGIAIIVGLFCLALLVHSNYSRGVQLDKCQYKKPSDAALYSNDQPEYYKCRKLGHEIFIKRIDTKDPLKFEYVCGSGKLHNVSDADIEYRKKALGY